jgi:O-antigen/teichoic acid export membrane protein
MTKRSIPTLPRYSILTGAIAAARRNRVERSLVRGVVGTALLNLATMGVNFVITLTLSHTLGVRGYGAYVFALAWSGLLAVPGILGLTPLIVRNVAHYSAQESWGMLRGLLARANLAVTSSSFLVIAVAAGVGTWLIHPSDSELLDPFLIGLLLVPVIALTSVRQSAMQGLGHVVLGRVPETLIGPAVFLLLVGIARLTLGHRFSATWGMSAQVAAGLVAFAIGAWLLRRTLPAAVRSSRPSYELRKWVLAAVPLFLYSGVQLLNSQVEIILLGVFKGSEAAGIFSVASRVAAVIAFVGVAASYPLSPLIARLQATGDMEALRETAIRSARWIFLASLPIAAAVMLLAQPLLTLFGGEFKGGVTALLTLSLGQLVFAATSVAGIVLVMTGHESSLTRAVAIGAIVGLVLNLVLIPPFGLEGAAAGSAISWVSFCIVVAVYARRRASVPSTALGL